MCFRLEGKCEHDDSFILLQEGIILFAGDLRQSCTTIVVERGRESYFKYNFFFVVVEVATMIVAREIAISTSFEDK